jgi:hypothetical protein
MIQDDSLIALFLLEVQNYSEVLRRELYTNTNPDMEVLIRAVHSIRGASRIIQHCPGSICPRELFGTGESGGITLGIHWLDR